jgi:hypothetical protein
MATIPHWFLLLLSGVIPAWWMLRFHSKRRRERRQSQGLCMVCGYNLQETPNRCPECGAVPAGREAA